MKQIKKARRQRYVMFLFAPGFECDDPVMNKLLREHEAEADRQGAEFWNYGKVQSDRAWYSKTSKGYLDSSIDAHTTEVTHVWRPW
jgi:hypothetical protein